MNTNNNKFSRISIEKSNKLIKHNSNLTIADIRDKQSFETSRIPNAIHITSESVNDFIEKTDKEMPLLVYCYHGNSSIQAADYFARNGFEQVYSMDGGYSEYEKRYASD